LAISSVCFGLRAWVIGVVMKPGAMQFAVIVRAASSRASDFVMPIMPALEAA
jgi:hypothetical protein